MYEEAADMAERGVSLALSYSPVTTIASYLFISIHLQSEVYLTKYQQQMSKATQCKSTYQCS